MKKMLVVVAHPSDESFVFGGLISAYTSLGWDVRITSVTGGTLVSDIALDVEVQMKDSQEQKEMKHASNILGVLSVDFLGYKEGSVAQISPGTLEAQLEDRMRELLPDIVVTFGVNGINNDPDHIKVCYSTTYAFQKYTRHLEELNHPETLQKGRGKEWKQFEYQRAFGETGEFEKVPRLYYGVYPASVTVYLQKIKSLPLESFAKPWVGTLDKYVTTVVEIGNMKQTKINALASYVSSKSEIDPFTGFEKNPFLIREYYVLRMQGIYEVYMGKTDRVSDVL